MKALILDTDPVSQAAICAALQSIGLTTALAVSSREAIDKLEVECPVDVIVADIAVQGQDGFEFLRLLKGNSRINRIPVLMCSAVSDTSVVIKAVSLGARDYLIKPVNKDVLIAKIQRILEQREGAVLLVDDDPIIRSLLKRVVEREGYRTLVAASAEEALRMVRENNLFAVLSDITLSGMSGLDLLVQIKEQTPDLPVMLITGNAGKYSREAVIAAGADGFITKPFKNIEITRKLVQFRGRSARSVAKPA